MSWVSMILLAAVSVRGSSDCPRSDEVARRLSSLTAPDSRRSSGPGNRARVEAAGGSVRVLLHRADGSVIGDRLLERAGSCQDMAAAAAVILASWDASAHPEYRANLPADRPAPTKEPVVALSKPAAVAPVISDRRLLDVGIGAGASLSGSHLAPALSVAATATFAGSRLGLRAAAGLTGWHQQALGEGLVEWRRWPLAAGAVLRLGGQRLAIDLGVEAIAAWLAARGRDFPVTHAHDRLALGVGANARLALVGGRVVPWLALGFAGWPGAETVRGVSASAALPSVDLGVTLGASFAR